MNEPILNPWMLYFCLKADNISEMLFTFALICGIIAGISLVTHFVTLNDCDEDVSKKAIKIFKYTIFPCVFFSILGTFCPSTKDVTLLLVNSQVTQANIAKASDITKDVYNQLKEDIFKAIEKSKDKEVEKK